MCCDVRYEEYCVAATKWRMAESPMAESHKYFVQSRVSEKTPPAIVLMCCRVIYSPLFYLIRLGFLVSNFPLTGMGNLATKSGRTCCRTLYNGSGAMEHWIPRGNLPRIVLKMARRMAPTWIPRSHARPLWIPNRSPVVQLECAIWTDANPMFPLKGHDLMDLLSVSC